MSESRAKLLDMDDPLAAIRARRSSDINIGAAGTLHVHTGWYRTLCPSCAAESEYVPVQR